MADLPASGALSLPQASLGHSERSRAIFSSFFVPTKKLAGAVEESLFALLRCSFSLHALLDGGESLRE